MPGFGREIGSPENENHIDNPISGADLKKADESFFSRVKSFFEGSRDEEVSHNISGEQTADRGTSFSDRLQELMDRVSSTEEKTDNDPDGKAGGNPLPASVEATKSSESPEGKKDDITPDKENEVANEFDECYSTYDERIRQTPREKSERGEWTGDRGESKYIPSDNEIKQILAQYELDGIEYKNGMPDFSECSETTVKIDNMTERRYGPGGNFEQCDQQCADKWNEEKRDGRTNWTARDVAEWRAKNGYSWHERNDMKTCDLVPTKINDYFGHLGGVSECKKRDAQYNEGDEFDE